MRYHRLRRAVLSALKVVMVEPYRTGRPLGKNLPHPPCCPPARPPTGLWLGSAWIAAGQSGD